LGRALVSQLVDSQDVPEFYTALRPILLAGI
jgi:hypothetical protein